MIGRFFSWWRDELLSFVPARLQRLFREQRNIVLVEIRGRRLCLWHVRDSQANPLGEIALSDDHITTQRDAVNQALQRVPGKASVIALDLPAEQLLSRRVTFPAAVAENLRPVVRYEMERRTPFKPEEVYFNVEIVDRTPDGEQINVELDVLPQEAVDDAISRVAALGLRPQRIGVATDRLSAALGVNFLPTEASQASRLETIAAAVLGLVAIGLLITAVALPLERKRSLSAQLTEQVAALRKEARVAQSLTTEIRQLGARKRFIAEKRQLQPAAITVIDDLTKLLPDDTWLFQMRLNGGRVSVHGFADAASELVELIESSPRFDNVAVKSQLTRDPKTGLERFHITFNVAANGG